MSGVQNLACTYARKVTVPLIGKDYFVRVCPFHARRHGRGPAVGDFNHINVNVIVL
jgi:hypothetical protein